MKMNNKGFSLVELMVVVAIIGILAAIAVPNFQKFSAKAKQAEAKANLSAVYSAARAYSAEWTFFRCDFGRNGYGPTGNLRYSHGFVAENGAALVAGEPTAAQIATGMNGINTVAYCADAEVVASPTNVCNIMAVPVAPTALGGTVCNNTNFTANARAMLLQNGVEDQWTINEQKVLTNVQPGY
jgi:type IV pilus assembly protein PilA